MHIYTYIHIYTYLILNAKEQIVYNRLTNYYTKMN